MGPGHNHQLMLWILRFDFCIMLCLLIAGACYADDCNVDADACMQGISSLKSRVASESVQIGKQWQDYIKNVQKQDTLIIIVYNGLLAECSTVVIEVDSYEQADQQSKEYSCLEAMEICAEYNNLNRKVMNIELAQIKLFQFNIPQPNADKIRQREAVSGLVQDGFDIYEAFGDYVGPSKNKDASGAKAPPKEKEESEFMPEATEEGLFGEDPNAESQATLGADDGEIGAPKSWKPGMEIPSGWKRVPNNVEIVTDEWHVQMIDGDRVEKNNYVIVEDWIIVPDNFMGQREYVIGSLSDPKTLPGGGNQRYSAKYKYSYRASHPGDVRGAGGEFIWEYIKTLIFNEYENDVQIFESRDEYERFRNPNR